MSSPRAPAAGSPGTAEAGAEGPPAGTAAGRAAPAERAGMRIGDAAARVGLSARALRYYEELGLLTPSAHTAGGERRYGPADLERLARIVELRDVLGMNLDEVKGFLDTEAQLDQVRQAYRARTSDETPGADARRRALLEEILRLSESLADQLASKVERIQAFRADLLARVDRCRELLGHS